MVITIIITVDPLSAGLLIGKLNSTTQIEEPRTSIIAKIYVTFFIKPIIGGKRRIESYLSI